MEKNIYIYKSERKAVFQTSKHSTTKLSHNTAINLATGQQNAAFLFCPCTSQIPFIQSTVEVHSGYV